MPTSQKARADARQELLTAVILWLMLAGIALVLGNAWAANM